MISKFLVEVQSALRSNPRPYFPLDATKRKRQNLKLGREIGYGLGMFVDWKTWAGTTYGRFVVAHSLDSVGVVIDNREWIAAITEGVRKYAAGVSTQ